MSDSDGSDLEREVFLATVHNLTSKSGVAVVHGESGELQGLGISMNQLVILIRVAAVLVGICQGRTDKGGAALQGAIGMLAISGLIQLPATAKWVASGDIDENLDVLAASVGESPELSKQIFAVEGLA